MLTSSDWEKFRPLIQYLNRQFRNLSEINPFLIGGLDSYIKQINVFFFTGYFTLDPKTLNRKKYSLVSNLNWRILYKIVYFVPISYIVTSVYSKTEITEFVDNLLVRCKHLWFLKWFHLVFLGHCSQNQNHLLDWHIIFSKSFTFIWFFSYLLYFYSFAKFSCIICNCKKSLH